MNKDNLLISKIEDNLKIADKTQNVRFIGFLNEFEVSDTKKYLNKNHARQFDYFGGYSNAIRAMLAVYPLDFVDDEYNLNKTNKFKYPFSCVKFSFKNENDVTHSDVLGALMKLNIKRDTIGDIIIKPTYAITFILNSVYALCFEIEKISKYNVVVTQISFDDFEDEPTFVNFQKIIASNRLDCIVAQIAKLSREKATSLITSKLIFLNGVVIENPSKKIVDNDILTIRKTGKFILNFSETQTKKGRMIMNYKKFS